MKLKIVAFCLFFSANWSISYSQIIYSLVVNGKEIDTKKMILTE